MRFPSDFEIPITAAKFPFWLACLANLSTLSLTHNTYVHRYPKEFNDFLFFFKTYLALYYTFQRRSSRIDQFNPL